MKRRVVHLPVLLGPRTVGMLLLASSVVAGAPPMPPRTWTDASGKYATEASLQSFTASCVVLETGNGPKSVDLEWLSDDDRAHVLGVACATKSDRYVELLASLAAARTFSAESLADASSTVVASFRERRTSITRQALPPGKIAPSFVALNAHLVVSRDRLLDLVDELGAFSRNLDRAMEQARVAVCRDVANRQAAQLAQRKAEADAVKSAYARASYARYELRLLATGRGRIVRSDGRTPSHYEQANFIADLRRRANGLGFAMPSRKQPRSNGARKLTPAEVRNRVEDLSVLVCRELKLLAQAHLDEVKTLL